MGRAQVKYSEIALMKGNSHDNCCQAAECLEKTAETMRLLAREGAGRFVLLTGAVMRGLAREVLNLRCAQVEGARMPLRSPVQCIWCC